MVISNFIPTIAKGFNVKEFRRKTESSREGGGGKFGNSYSESAALNNNNEAKMRSTRETEPNEAEISHRIIVYLLNGSLPH